MAKDNTKIIDIQITTDLHSLQMLSRKHSKESQVASYVYGMTKAMLKDIEKIEKSKVKMAATRT